MCLNYGRVTSAALDPIEKKPLARFCPGSMILSVGSCGCNMDCPFCQNYEIAGAGEDFPAESVTPRRLAELAEGLKTRGNIGLAYTYNEPLVGWEFVRDCAIEIRARGMKNVLVTNGTAEPEIQRELLPLIDAYNIDLKGFTEEWYKKLGGDLETVKRFIAAAAGAAHVELTTLIVPGENDGEDEMRELSSWIASLDRRIPLHVTRFFPRRLMTGKPPTPKETLFRLAEIAREKLETVIVGNV